MTVPDFTQIDLHGARAEGEEDRTAWEKALAASGTTAPAAWDSPEGIPVSPLYTAADLSGRAHRAQ